MVPPEHSFKGLRKVFPDADGEILKGIGHHPQEEVPTKTLKWIVKWSKSTIHRPMLLSGGEPFD